MTIKKSKPRTDGKETVICRAIESTMDKTFTVSFQAEAGGTAAILVVNDASRYIPGESYTLTVE